MGLYLKDMAGTFLLAKMTYTATYYMPCRLGDKANNKLELK